ncbi:hypothetical protein [Pleionea sediminis]|uniref:hypothetical protein n=1 Tax=Pleionea sediminis TaxID=2569479 RepID=UPI0011860611|nr:hypothetical protein [Pleionea sediminis]
MNEANLPYIVGLQLAGLIILILFIGLWFTFRELRKARKKGMRMRREYARMNRRIKSLDAQAPSATKSNPIKILQQALSETEQKYEEDFAENDISKLDEQVSQEELSLALRRLLIKTELDLRLEDNDSFTLDAWIDNLTEPLKVLKANSSPSTQPAESSVPTDSADSESEYYKKLYDDLLVTLQRSKQTIRSLALRLSDIIDDGMDEDQLNALVEELNNSMDAFGELSGITSSTGNQQMEDDVKEIRRAYEMGMNLMEHFENALKQSADIKEAVDEHLGVVESNRANYEEGETIDRDAILANNKRYSRLLDESKVTLDELAQELDGGKEIIGNFLAMTRKFQDQSTRVAILQSREKQLNSDLRQSKVAQEETKENVKLRDILLGALHNKYVESADNELVNKLCTFADELYRLDKEISGLDQSDKTSGAKNKRKELNQKRGGIEAQIKELVGSIS